MPSFRFKELSPYQSLVPISKLEIPMKNLEIEKAIGEGSFSEVFLASVSGTHLRMQEGKKVAAKKLKGESLISVWYQCLITLFIRI